MLERKNKKNEEYNAVDEWKYETNYNIEQEFSSTLYPVYLGSLYMIAKHFKGKLVEAKQISYFSEMVISLQV